VGLGAASVTTIAGDLTVTSDLTVNGDNITFESANADDPKVIIKNTTADAQGARLQFKKDRGVSMVQGDRVGELDFIGEDADQNQQQYGKMLVKADVVTGGQESGELIIQVASHDANLENGLILVGGSVDAEVDVTIAAGAASTTTIAGTLTMGTVATIDNDGAWVGGVIPSAKLDADTAHLAGAQTFTGTKTLNSFKGTAGATVTNILDEDAMGSDSATALATQQSIKAYADTKSLLAGSSSVTTLGTIGTGVWEGTAIASDQQKHLAHYKFMGFNNSATATNVYEYSATMTDTKAPMEHDKDHNATITTAMDVSDFFSSGGQVVPQAGTIKRIVGWAHTGGTSAVHKIALVKLTPANDDNTDVSPVLIDEVSWTSLGADKLKAINETTITAASVAAGDILMTMIKDDTGSRTIYFNLTVEIEF